MKSRAVVEGGLDFVWVCDHNVGVVSVLCGHCGVYSKEEVEVLYHAPEEAGLSYKEQEDQWVESFTYSHVCRKCGVLNVDGEDLETFVRKQRQAWADVADKLRRLFGNDHQM